jgi:tyrosyl-tRNA synthetase
LFDRLHLVGSRSEAKRKIQEGAVEVNGEKITKIDFELEAGIDENGNPYEYEIRVGKKFAKVCFSSEWVGG